MELDRALLMKTFFAEAQEQLTAMEEGIVGLEHRPDDPDLLATVFRAAHTLKGNAAIVDLTEIASRANQIEDALDALRTGARELDAGLVTSILGLLDELRTELSESLEGGDSDPVLDAPDSRGATLRIDASKLDRMLSLSGEISIARGRLRTHLQALGHAADSAMACHLEAERLYRELQDEIMRARLVPLGPIFRQYQRVVRDLALEHGKRVELSIEGEDVEIDTALGEQIRGPLMHMLRNALDHGIEPPERRQACGKKPVGSIMLSARRDASHIVITVRDDGAGFSRARIAARAHIADAGRSLTDDELFRLALEPGFSTAEAVTSLSGRGVGMDVVKRNVEALRGSITISSTEGEGATIGLRLPLTLAIIEGFFVEVGDETFVIPLDAVMECQTLSREETARCGGTGLVSYRDKPLPYVRLRELLHLSENGARPRAREHVAIVRSSDRVAGIAVDTLLGQDQAVIKPLGHMFRDAPGIAGSTIGGDGRVALILDVAALLDLAEVNTRQLSQEEVA